MVTEKIEKENIYGHNYHQKSKGKYEKRIFLNPNHHHFEHKLSDSTRFQYKNIYECMYVNIPGDDCEERVCSIWRLLRGGGEIEG